MLKPCAEGYLLWYSEYEIYMRREEMDSKGKIFKPVLTAGILILLTLVFIGIYKTTDASVQDDMLIVTGMYGIKIPTAEIEDVIKIENIPIDGKRKNGLGLGPIKIGYFYYDKLGDVRLYILKPESPYLLITSKTEKIIIGLGKNKNETLYSTLKK